MDKSWLDSTPPRAAFMFGLVLGIGVMAMAALIILVVMIFKGGVDFGTSANTNSPTRTTPTATAPTAPTAPSAPVEVTVSENDNIIGNPDAAVTIIEFSDFQCPFCGQFAPSVAQILAENPDDVRLVYKHFPLDSIHPQARPAAEASECAAEQGKFKEYHDGLFDNQEKLSNDYYTTLAGEIGLDTSQFSECLTSGKYSQKVEDDYQMGLAAGARGTPHSIINGSAVSGAVPYAQLKSIVDGLLAE